MEYQLTRPTFETIIDYCNSLEGDEKLIVFEFGENYDLILHIYKDEEFNSKKRCGLCKYSPYQHRTKWCFC